MRSHLVLVSLFAFALGNAAHATPAKKAGARDLPRLDDEEYAVIAAVLRDDGHDPEITLVFHEVIAPEEADASAAEYESTDLEQKTVDSFRERNAKGGRLEKRFPLKNPVYFLSKEEQASFWKGVSCEQGWSRYYAAHPHATGILDVSRVGVNHDHTQALVYFAGQGACLAGGGALYELEKFHGEWKVVQKFRLWVS